MSKLARILAVAALLTAMSLGSSAHAQDGDVHSQQAGVTQSDPSQPQPPGEATPQPRARLRTRARPLVRPRPPRPPRRLRGPRRCR